MEIFTGGQKQMLVKYFENYTSSTEFSPPVIDANSIIDDVYKKYASGLESLKSTEAYDFYMIYMLTSQQVGDLWGNNNQITIKHLSEASKIYFQTYQKEILKQNTARAKEWLKSTYDNASAAFYLSSTSILGGGICFAAGAVVQYIYDFVMTIVDLAFYAYYGIQYLFSSPQKEEDSLGITPEIKEEFTPVFDIESFLKKDIPELIKMLNTTIINILNDFIQRPSWYATIMASVHKVYIDTEDKLVTALYEALFEKYPYQSAWTEKILWAYRQWYYAGAAIGPLIIDIILMFVPGGQVSGATKVAKGARIATCATRIEKLEAITDIKKIAHLIPEELMAWIKRMVIRFNELIEYPKQLIEKAIEQAISTGQKLTEEENKKILAKVQQWKDMADNLNFFVSIVVYAFGNGEINENGELA